MPFGYRQDLSLHLSLSERVCLLGLPAPELEAGRQGKRCGISGTLGQYGGTIPLAAGLWSAFQPDGDGTIVDERHFHLRAKPAQFGRDAPGA